MSEGYMQTAIIAYLKGLPRCRVINIHGSNSQEAGISDLLICYKGIWIALELKKTSPPSKLQLLFLRSIRRAEGIGELAYDIDIVKRIIRCIDEGDTWEPVSNLGLRKK